MTHNLPIQCQQMNNTLQYTVVTSLAMHGLMFNIIIIIIVNELFILVTWKKVKKSKECYFSI
mgnify:CR=1 FL=1